MRELELLQILPIDLDKSGLRLGEALWQPGDGRLARTAASDDADDSPGFDIERDILDGGGRRARIVEGDILEFDLAADAPRQLTQRRLRLCLHQLRQELQ